MRRGLKLAVSWPFVPSAVQPRARPPMRRGLKRAQPPAVDSQLARAARAAPYEKGTETEYSLKYHRVKRHAARAAPYEKGTETSGTHPPPHPISTQPRARPPMRRGLKPIIKCASGKRAKSRARGPL